MPTCKPVNLPTTVYAFQHLHRVPTCWPVYLPTTVYFFQHHCLIPTCQAADLSAHVYLSRYLHLLSTHWSTSLRAPVYFSQRLHLAFICIPANCKDKLHRLMPLPKTPTMRYKNSFLPYILYNCQSQNYKVLIVLSLSLLLFNCSLM
jgi:hypothetical protein